MRSGIAAAVLMAAGLAVWVGTNNQQALAAPSWNDVLQQSMGVRTVYMDMRTYKAKELVGRVEIWVQSPGMIRTQSYESVDGQMLPAEGAVATPDSAVRWHDRTRLAEQAAMDNPYMANSATAATIEAMLGVSVLGSQPNADVQINGEQVEFVPAGEQHPLDSTLRGFRLQLREKAQAPLPGVFSSIIYWFDGKSNTLRRISARQDEQQWEDMVVTLNPSVPADWFGTGIPDGFFDVHAGVRPRLSPEVRDVYDQVSAARERFGDYRAVIWRDQTGGWPTHREARRGQQWRCDMIDWTVMHSALYSGDNPRGYVRIGPDDAFADAWKQVTRQDYELEVTAMTWNSRYAVLHYKLSGRGPRTSAKVFDQVGPAAFEGPLFAPALRFMAWPEWISWENLQPHGWSIQDPALQWRLLPSDPGHPDLVEVIGEREGGDLRTVRYTFDRSRGWLCVRQEMRSSLDTDTVAIEATAQTPEGMWYPRQVRLNLSGGDVTYDYAVQRGTVEPAFFNWPADMPQPTDLFAPLRTMQPASATREDLPATAKGKYTTSGSAGLPRGFDDQATSEAHSLMVRNMRTIEGALDSYAYKHKWVFPESIDELVQKGFIKAEDLTNPLHPTAQPPFGYVRPQINLPNRGERMVLYEPSQTWPGVVTVMFQDGSVEHIHDQAEFKRLMQEATAPEPPSRPYGD